MRTAPKFLLLLALSACGPLAAQPQEGGGRPSPGPEDFPPKSVILLIGDGMGPQQMALLFDWADAAGVGPTQIERMGNAGVVGMARTGAADSPLTDSAASATALASGIKTLNGAIGVDVRQGRVRTCLEEARDKGRSTGIVTTTRVTHATPACFATHVPDRSLEQMIAQQFIKESGVDVILGGGLRFFPPAALAEAKSKGYAVATSEEELAALPAETSKILGLFHSSHLPYVIDRDGPGEESSPTLTALTERALSVLSRDEDGFFLMVEGGRIDHGGHGNDVAAVLGEMREFDDTLAVCLAFQREHPETLVILTADHETGGLAISAPGRRLEPKDFLAMAAATRTVGASLERGEIEQRRWSPELLGTGRVPFYPPETLVAVVPALKRSSQFGVSFGSQSHTTTPVAVLAIGPGAAEFAGIYQNTRIGERLRDWMGR